MLHHSWWLRILCLPLVVCLAEDRSATGLVSRFSVSEFDGAEGDQGRLRKRAPGDLGERVLLDFEAIGKRFGLLLESNDEALQEQATVRTFRNGTFEESPVHGRVYSGRHLIVLGDKAPAETDMNMIMRTKSSDETSPFAQFYLEKDVHGKIMAQGGFIHEDLFYQVHHESHPAKSKPATMSNVNLAEDRLVVATQPVNEMHGFGEQKREDGSVRRFQCGHDTLRWNTNVDGAPAYFNKEQAKKHSNSTLMMENRLEGSRTYSTGCPVNRKTLLVGVVADCNYVRAFQGDRGKIQTSIIQEFALVSAIYEKSFNLNLGLVAIDLMMDCDTDEHAWNSACRPKHLLGEQMSKFSLYRENLRKDVGVYHLVTDCLHTEVVGIAWLNQVCRTNNFLSGRDYVSGTSASTLIKNHFAVIAHEIAHNMGAIHDCDKTECMTCDVRKGNCDCCPCGDTCDCKDKFIMSPGSGTVDVREFSQCTLDWVCKKMPILATCLVKPGLKRTLRLGQCGNGIREDDEECDCGTPEQCAKDPCCQEGCKLRQGAECTDTNDTCCRQCKIIPAAEKFACGKSNGFCQFSSYCDGGRECPLRKIRRNGTPCKDVDNGRCSSGVCTSRDAQCQAIGGQLGVRKACETTFNSCDMLCQGSADRCLSFKAKFSDGVACGMNGFCKDGACSESVVVTAITKYWLAIILIAGFFLAALLACVLASCNISEL